MERRINDKILYSSGALGTILNLAIPAHKPMHEAEAEMAFANGKAYSGMRGRLRLWKDGNHMYIFYRGNGRRADKIAEYTGRIKMDGTHEAMMVALKFQESKR